MPDEKVIQYIIKDLKPSLETTIDYKSQLNPQQYEVVTKADGPCLVLAGAGSGKTRTLIYRVAYLLEKGIKAQNILLVTFTNKAARLMQDRVEALLKAKPKGLWSGTFHHIGNRSIRMYASHIGYKEEFGILDEEDSLGLIKVCIKGLKFNTQEERFPKPSVIQAIISYSINAKEPVRDTLGKKFPYFIRFSNHIEEIKALYEKKKKQSNNLDYDDLLTKWIHLLKNSKVAFDRLTKQFQYILVDEYQDTNRLQSDIIELLCSFHKNILVVGDDAQSIYSFRAADINNILQFPEKFPDTKIFKLETNYRSTPQILDLANESILNNTHQFPKRLKAVCETGAKPAYVRVKDVYHQAEFIAQRMLELRDEGIALEDMAVLFRAHYQSAELELELTKRGIPYVIRGGVRFFEQAHIKDVLSYLKIIQNPLDEISWIRCLSTHSGIGPVYADRVYQEVAKSKGQIKIIFSKNLSSILPKRAHDGFLKFVKIIKSINDASLYIQPDMMIKNVIENGYEKFCLLNFENAQDRLDDLKELINFAHGYKSLKEFLTDVTLREGFKGETFLGGIEEDEYTILTTIHQSKGLEWKIVFIAGLCEGQFPHSKVLEDALELEEERRLFYVAVTRCKNQLYLVHPMTRYDYNYGTVIARPSQFLEEIPSGFFEIWQAIEEDKYI